MHSITLRFLAAQGTVSPAGRIHGGTILRWVDEARQACASGWARGHCVTAFMGGASFEHAIHVGDLVEVHARLVFTHLHSMSVMLEVRSAPVYAPEMRVVARCCAEYDALDPEGNRREVDHWSPETPGDIALAQRLKAHIDAARAAL